MVEGTLVKLDTVTLGSAQAAIEFININQNYDDLLILLSGRTTSNVAGEQWVFCEFNINAGGVGTNQTSRNLTGRASAESFTSGGRFYISSSASTANTFGSVNIYIPNYRSNTAKSISVESVSEDNSVSSAFMQMAAISWSGTSAITSLSFTPRTSSGNFAIGSTATLYGVTRIPRGAKATGGVITETDTHWIHTFTTSDVFTPNTNITVDYLVVAGGGGGGSQDAEGGGGAGGYRTTVGTSGANSAAESPLSVIANTSYTVTVGGGGTGSTITSSKGGNGSNSVFSTITSTGGGGGGSNNGGALNNATALGNNGGSGGGNAYNQRTVGTVGQGTANQGLNGAIGDLSGSPQGSGGGGGGASQNGSPGLTNGVGGKGGDGLASTISGTSVTRAGGGGGSGVTQGAGGAGGGGAGGGNSGTANTGGGGGGGRSGNGGSGGSGIVIVRYSK